MPLFISSFLCVLGDGRGIGNAWADRSVCRASSRQGPLQIMTKNDHVNHLIFLSSPCVRLQGEGVGWCLAPSVRIPTLLAPSSSRRRWNSRQGRAKKSRKLHCRPPRLPSPRPVERDKTSGFVSESEAESAREGRGGNRPPGKLA